MANLIGKLRGISGDSKSGKVEVSSTRVAEDEVSTEANSWNTFVTTTVDRLGRVTIVIRRAMNGRSTGATVLTEITLNSESSDSPIFTADGLLREQIAKRAVDDYIFKQHGLDDERVRDLASDITEDR